ncbi:MAG: hypothetical protein HY779_01035 [Rubrobacteridae bacterium]|nr:hypothetical protein [Rubrobacteridae bacterium]
MSEIENVVDQVMKQIGSSNVNAIFGEPVRFEDKVVIPVGKIGYGWGGGGGKTEKENGEGQVQEEEENSGMGFGMGAKVSPIGYIAITRDKVTFQPVMDIAPVCIIWSVFGGMLMLMLAKYTMLSKLIRLKKRK